MKKQIAQNVHFIPPQDATVTKKETLPVSGMAKDPIIAHVFQNCVSEF